MLLKSVAADEMTSAENGIQTPGERRKQTLDTFTFSLILSQRGNCDGKGALNPPVPTSLPSPLEKF